MQPALSFEQAPPISVPYRFFLTAPVFGVVAGLILFLWARGFKARVTATEWRASFVVAALFFLVMARETLRKPAVIAAR